MSYDFAQLFWDNAVPHWTDGNNVSGGWVNVECVFCDDPSNHLGFSEEGACVCWRCGGHSTSEAILILTGQDWDKIQVSYQGGAGTHRHNQTQAAPPSLLALPVGTKPMADVHRQYLERRNFDPDKLVRLYGLQGTGIIGPYKFRIIVPILQRGRLVSFQGRDYTGRSDLRYKTCEKEKEIVFHKHLLYNADAIPGTDVVVVEGVTDVWRLGAGSVATFGTGFTQEQVIILAGYRRVFLLYDGEDAAMIRAEKLARAISGLGAEVELVILRSGDPAELKQDDANNLMKELIGRR